MYPSGYIRPRAFKMKYYINALYSDRNEITKLGALWDPKLKKFYAPNILIYYKLYKWTSIPLSNFRVVEYPIKKRKINKLVFYQ